MNDKVQGHMEPFIRTWSGRKFNLLTPEPTTILIEDIAHALSLQCRFNGHCDEFYSVAEHSVEVCKLVEKIGMKRNIVLTALLHDAAEAYTGDVVSPLKNLLPEFKRIESNLERHIAERFGLVYPFPEAVHVADKKMLQKEFSSLKPFCNDSPRKCLSPSMAEAEFLSHFYRLCA